MNPKQEDKDLKIKHFGFLVSAFLLVISNIGLVNEWSITPFLFIVTMYFLTGSLWGIGLIRGFYYIFRKVFFQENNSKDSKASGDHFSKN